MPRESAERTTRVQLSLVRRVLFEAPALLLGAGLKGQTGEDEAEAEDLRPAEL
jgi:hypothetical protein